MTTGEHLSTETNDGTVNAEKAVQQKKPDPVMKFLFKFYIILSIPVIFFIMVYLIWLFACKVDISFQHGNPGISEEPDPRVWAENKISALLTKNSYGCITAHKNSSEGLTIEVSGDGWNALSRIKQKAFIRDIARARNILGLPNNLTVIDNASKTAYGTYSTPHGVWLVE